MALGSWHSRRRMHSLRFRVVLDTIAVFFLDVKTASYFFQPEREEIIKPEAYFGEIV